MSICFSNNFLRRGNKHIKWGFKILTFFSHLILIQLILKNSKDKIAKISNKIGELKTNYLISNLRLCKTKLLFFLHWNLFLESLVEQELLTLPEHLGSARFLVGFVFFKLCSALQIIKCTFSFVRYVVCSFSAEGF